MLFAIAKLIKWCDYDTWRLQRNLLNMGYLHQSYEAFAKAIVD